MTRNLFFFFLFAMAGLVVSGCDDMNCCMRSVIKFSDPSNPYESGETQTMIIEFSPTSGEELNPYELFLTCSMHWTLHKPADFPNWIKVSPESGPGSTTIRITAGDNLSGGDLEGYPLVFLAANGDTAKVEVWQPTRIEMASIPATPAEGFWMGSTKDNSLGANYYSGAYDNEQPVHQVVLRTFRMGMSPVTNQLYAMFLNSKGVLGEADGSVITGGDGTNIWIYDCTTKPVSPGGPTLAWGVQWDADSQQWMPSQKDGINYEDYPVIMVTWFGAKAFCDWLSEQTGQTCRLPTEAEWEYACRGGSGDAWSFGNDSGALSKYAIWSGNSGNKTYWVGSKLPNGYNLYDMHGNVWEWCSDWFSDSYYASSPKDNPQGPGSGTSRVIRGGGYSLSADGCRSAYRYDMQPASTLASMGFRIVMQ